MKDPHALSAAFMARFGRKPEGLWAAPGRVNLIGEHTDYNDGFVLPFALQQAAVVAVARRSDDQIQVYSLDLDESFDIAVSDLAPAATRPVGVSRGWGDYLVGVVWALRQDGHPIGGLDVALSSDVPIGAGLSSSAALECAMVAALCDLNDLEIAHLKRAQLAQVAENSYVGAPTGLLDQAASTLCEADSALFLDCRTLEHRQVELGLDRADLELLVLDTKTPHSHVDGEYAERRRTCDSAAALLEIPALRDVSDLDTALAELTMRGATETMLKRVRHVVTEDMRVLAAVATADAGRIADLGPLMNESHISMRDDFEITVPTVDLAVEAARDAGAVGARMTGGGFGGCIIALCRQGHGQRVGERVASAFAAAGFGAPEFFVASPSAGARRLH